MTKASEILTRLTLDNSGFVARLEASRERLGSFAASAAATGRGLMVAGGGILAAAALTVRAASNVEETMNKFDVVFNRNRRAVKAWADEYAAQVGRSREQIAAFVANAQDLFIPLGFDETAAIEMSKQMTQLGLDLASFNNKADAEPMVDLSAALTGSGEVMKKYGVIVTETAVRQRLLADGINPSGATEQQKVMARFNIILAGTRAAQGDALRSAGAFANQLKGLQGETSNTSSAFGNALLPAATALVAAMRSGVKSVGEFAAAHPGAVQAAVAVGVALTGLGATFLAVAAGAKAVQFALAGKILVMKALTAVAGPAATALRGFAVSQNMARSFDLATGVGLLHRQLGLVVGPASKAAAAILLLGNAEAATAAKGMLAGKLRALAAAATALPSKIASVAAALKSASLAQSYWNATVAGGQALAGTMSALLVKLASGLSLSATAAGVAAKGAAVGFLIARVAAMKLGAALSFLAAHPVLVVVTAAVGAAVAATTMLASAEREAVRAANDLADARRKAAEADTSALAERDKLRSADRELLNRLGELSERQRLSGVEQVEASSIIERLSSRYGDLSVSIDSATGKLVDFGQATSRVQKQMNEQEADDLRAAIKSANADIEAQRAAMNSEAFSSPFAHIGQSGSEIAAEIAARGKQIEAAQDRLLLLRQRLNEVMQNRAANTSGAKQTVSTAKATEAQKAVNETGEQLRADKLSSLQKEIEDLDKVHKARIANLELLKKYHAEQADAAQKRLGDAEEVGDTRAADRAREALAIERANQLETSNQLSAARRDYDAALQGARDKAAAAINAERDDVANADRDRSRRAYERDEGRTLDRLKDDSPERYAMAVDGLVAAAEMQREAARQQIQAALDRAAADGELSDAERDDIARQREIYERFSDRVEALRERAREAAEGAAASRPGKAAVGYDIDVLARQLGGDGARDQLAAQREMAGMLGGMSDQVDRIERRLRGV